MIQLTEEAKDFVSLDPNLIEFIHDIEKNIPIHFGEYIEIQGEVMDNLYDDRSILIINIIQNYNASEAVDRLDKFDREFLIPSKYHEYHRDIIIDVGFPENNNKKISDELLSEDVIKRLRVIDSKDEIITQLVEALEPLSVVAMSLDMFSDSDFINDMGERKLEILVSEKELYKVFEVLTEIQTLDDK